MDKEKNSAGVYDVLCIGGGPAGLTAAYMLAKAGLSVVVLEKDPVHVGGISRTEAYKGYLCDIGGHRFFTKSDDVQKLWEEVLGEEFLTRPRKSRIYYNGRFFDYPLQAWDALFKLGFFQSLLCMASYVKASMFPVANPTNFEDWVSNKFGRRLFSVFFKTYTEKVWGMKCSDISADWAAQRIKGLSLGKAICNALQPKWLVPKSGVVSSLIESFRYPKRGPGMMWEAMRDRIEQAGGEVFMGEGVVGCFRNNAAQWEITSESAQGKKKYTAAHIISSMPLPDLIRAITPPMPDNVIEAALELRYRDFLIVGLIVKDRKIFDDNWLYIHEPDVKVGRIQNFKSWSEEMVPEEGRNCFGMEYFCNKEDALWNSTDAELIALASDELLHLQLVERGDVIDGFVVRQPKAYPVYDAEYKLHLRTIRAALDKYCPQLQVVGRNGMHRYNNQDHSMMTAMLEAKNILSGQCIYDVWRVNEDAQYHEETPLDTPRGKLS